MAVSSEPSSELSSPPPRTAWYRPTYGWVIVVVAALAMVATLPGRTHGLGMVTERVLQDSAFQLDRESYANINLWATLLGGLFCLPCGWLIDRFGLRWTLSVTVAALAAVVLWMTHLAGNGPLFAAVLLTRGFGQSALSVISITMVGKWYRGRLGLPMAIYSFILSFGFVGAAQWAKPFANDDWRVLWGGMGWILLLGMLPLALLLTREPPADAPAEEEVAGAEAASAPQGLEGYTLAQAMRTPAFWAFGLAISIVALIGSGISLFNESVLKEQGFPAEVYYNVISFTGAIGILFKIPIGWLIRQVPLGKLQAIALVLKGICLLALPAIHTQFGITAYCVGMGIAGTMTTVLFFTIWGQAFGRRHLGQIQGIAQMMTVLASSLGPKVLAESFARSGSYAPAFQLIALSLFVVGVWSWMVRIPVPADAPREESAADSLVPSVSDGAPAPQAPV